MKNFAKQFLAAVLLVVILSACIQSVAPEAPNVSVSKVTSSNISQSALEPELPSISESSIQPQEQPNTRVIYAEPESNAENHLVKYGDIQLYLKSAIYDRDFSLEYYISACPPNDEGEFYFDSPTWVTLLLRTNGKIYPLQSLECNNFVRSLLCAKSPSGNGYDVWVVNEYANYMDFYKYTYGHALDSYIISNIYDDKCGYPMLYADLNHSLEEVYNEEITFGRERYAQ